MTAVKWLLIFVLVAVAVASKRNDPVRKRLNANSKGTLRALNRENGRSPNSSNKRQPLRIDRKSPAKKHASTNRGKGSQLRNEVARNKGVKRDPLQNGPVRNKGVKRNPSRNGVPKIMPPATQSKLVVTKDKKPLLNDELNGDHFINLGELNGTDHLLTRVVAGPECGDFLLGTDNEGILYSGDDKFKMKCVTTFESPVGTTITIQCPHFTLASKGCKREKLIVKDPIGGNKVTGCKNDDVSMTTTSNQLELKHIRKKLKKKECTGGFMCSIRVNGDPTVTGECGAYNLAADEISIIFSTNDRGKRNCKYNIQGPDDRTLEILCTMFSLNKAGCKKERLVITEPNSGDSLTYCSGDPNPDLIVATNDLTVQHIRKKLKKKQCSGGFLCYVGATGAAPGPGPTTGPGPGPGPGPEPTPAPSRPFCDGCGTAQISLPRIVGGEEATPGEYPWQALLDVGSSICGGTLIKKDWVLTAAHCFVLTGATSAIVYLGVHDLTVSTDVNVQGYETSSITTHPEYDEFSQNNDIALVYLGQEAVITNRVQTICLADPQDVSAGDVAVTTGWGVQEEGSETISDTLQEVAVDIISGTECASLYTNTFSITENMLCTLTDGKDSCQGDSGGPLVKQISDGRWVQVGVISFGLGCAQPNQPGVYARVTNYIDWITTTTASGTC